MIKAFVPLAEMFGYATDLRSKTQGRGNYSMFFDKYEPVSYTHLGMYVYSFVNNRATNSSDAKEDILEPLQERITGRYLAEDIVDPATGEVIVEANHLVTPKRAEAIIKTGVDKVKIRTILTCRSHIGVCAKCYGTNMATGQTVQVGEAVGIIAAQSIGEPGTQLTMRTFHTGGAVSYTHLTYFRYVL